jgi:alpha-beta hydrolase superfamily lysophospholipase
LCLIVLAPLFDQRRFPGWRYQRGGIVHRHRVRPLKKWTGRIVVALADWAQRREGRHLNYYLLGHSAGAQFLSRVAAFVPTRARRIVIANPSTHVFPTLRVKAPFGLGGVYSRSFAKAELRRYLAQPVTIFLGREDTGNTDRNDSKQARAQGRTRLERGRNAYKAAKRLARARGWTFNWRLVTAPGVGHSAPKMFHSKRILAALAP